MVYAVFTGSDHARAGQFFLRISLSHQMVFERFPVGRTESDTEGLDRLFIQSSLFQIFSRERSLG